MKLWGTVRKNNEIIRQHTIEYAGLTRGMAEGWDELIGPLCHELDLSRPVMLKKHLKELEDFSRVVFRADDFMEPLALILVIIGALNWGLVGLFQFDLVASLFGGMSGTFARIIYTLVGLAGVWGISLLFRRDGIRHHDDSAD